MSQRKPTAAGDEGAVRRSSRIAVNSPAPAAQPAGVTKRRSSASSIPNVENAAPAKLTRAKRLSLSQEPGESAVGASSPRRSTRGASRSPTSSAAAPATRKARRGSITDIIEESARADSPVVQNKLPRVRVLRSASKSPESAAPVKSKGRRPSITEKVTALESIDESEQETKPKKRGRPARLIEEIEEVAEEQENHSASGGTFKVHLEKIDLLAEMEKTRSSDNEKKIDSDGDDVDLKLQLDTDDEAPKHKKQSPRKSRSPVYESEIAKEKDGSNQKPSKDVKVSKDIVNVDDHNPDPIVESEIIVIDSDSVSNDSIKASVEKPTSINEKKEKTRDSMNERNAASKKDTSSVEKTISLQEKNKETDNFGNEMKDTAKKLTDKESTSNSKDKSDSVKGKTYKVMDSTTTKPAMKKASDEDIVKKSPKGEKIISSPKSATTSASPGKMSLFEKDGKDTRGSTKKTKPTTATASGKESQPNSEDKIDTAKTSTLVKESTSGDEKNKVHGTPKKSKPAMKKEAKSEVKIDPLKSATSVEKVNLEIQEKHDSCKKRKAVEETISKESTTNVKDKVDNSEGSSTKTNTLLGKRSLIDEKSKETQDSPKIVPSASKKVASEGNMKESNSQDKVDSLECTTVKASASVDTPTVSDEKHTDKDAAKEGKIDSPKNTNAKDVRMCKPLGLHTNENIATSKSTQKRKSLNSNVEKVMDKKILQESTVAQSETVHKFLSPKTSSDKRELQNIHKSPKGCILKDNLLLNEVEMTSGSEGSFHMNLSIPVSISSQEDKMENCNEELNTSGGSEGSDKENSKSLDKQPTKKPLALSDIQNTESKTSTPKTDEAFYEPMEVDYASDISVTIASPMVTNNVSVEKCENANDKTDLDIRSIENDNKVSKSDEKDSEVIESCTNEKISSIDSSAVETDNEVSQSDKEVSKIIDSSMVTEKADIEVISGDNNEKEGSTQSNIDAAAKSENASEKEMESSVQFNTVRVSQCKEADSNTIEDANVDPKHDHANEKDNLVEVVEEVQTSIDAEKPELDCSCIDETAEESGQLGKSFSSSTMSAQEDVSLIIDIPKKQNQEESENKDEEQSKTVEVVEPKEVVLDDSQQSEAQVILNGKVGDETSTPKQQDEQNYLAESLNSFVDEINEDAANLSQNKTTVDKEDSCKQEVERQGELEKAVVDEMKSDSKDETTQKTSNKTNDEDESKQSAEISSKDNKNQRKKERRSKRQLDIASASVEETDVIIPSEIKETKETSNAPKESVGGKKSKKSRKSKRQLDLASATSNAETTLEDEEEGSSSKLPEECVGEKKGENISKKQLDLASTSTKKSNVITLLETKKEKFSPKLPEECVDESSEDEGDIKVSLNRTPINEILDKLITEKMGNDYNSSDDEDYEPMNEFIDDMAFEGEEDTPSEDSNEIIEEGESLHSSESENLSVDEDYEDDSFINDDESGELLSGDEYDLTNEPKKTKTVPFVSYNEVGNDKRKKRSRIIEIDSSSDASDDSDVFVDDEQVLEVDELSEDIGEPVERVKQDDILINEQDNLHSLESIKAKADDAQMKGLDKTPHNSLAGSSPTKRNRGRTSISIQENIIVSDTTEHQIKDKISKAVSFLCSNVTENTGTVALNVSLDYANTSSPEAEPTEPEYEIEDNQDKSKQLKRRSLQEQFKINAKSPVSVKRKSVLSAFDTHNIDSPPEQIKKARKSIDPEQFGFNETEIELAEHPTETSIYLPKEVTPKPPKVTHKSEPRKKTKRPLQIQEESEESPQRKIIKKAKNFAGEEMLSSAPVASTSEVEGVTSKKKRSKKLTILPSSKLEKTNSWDIDDAEDMRPSKPSITKRTNVEAQVDEYRSKFRANDFKNQMIYDKTRNKRMDNKRILKLKEKTGKY